MVTILLSSPLQPESDAEVTPDKKATLMTISTFNCIMKFIVPTLCALNKRVGKSSRSF